MSKKIRYNNITHAPFAYFVPSLENISVAIIALLLPQIAMLVITKSYSSLYLIAASILASLSAEVLHNKVHRKKLFSNSLFATQGLLIAFFIPQKYPIVSAFFIIFFTLIASKYVFGGTFNSWINPIAICVIILYFFGNTFFPQNAITIADLQSTNPASNLFRNGSIPIINADQTITVWLNTKIFNHFGIEIPTGYISLLWDNGSSIPAFRFNILTLVASLFLIAFNMINSIIPTTFLMMYAILVRFFAFFPVGIHSAQGDILLALSTSGTLFAAFFALDWFGTTPSSTIGKIVYALIAGAFMYFIAGVRMSPVGVVFAMLCANIVSPLIQLCEYNIYNIIENKARENYV